MQKLENIEFLRIILIIGVLVTHAFHSAKWAFWRFIDVPVLEALKYSPNYGMNAVDAFFIISGFLLIYTFKDVNFKTFLAHKYKRLAPLVISSMLLCLCLSPLHWFPLKTIGDILSVFLLNNFGICWTRASNQDLWFSSVLFSGLLLYFPIIKIDSQKKKLIITSTIVICCYLLLEILRQGVYANPFQNYYGIINIGFIRGVGGIGLGCILCWFYKKYLKDLYFKFQNVLYSFLEIIFFSGMIYWLFLPHKKITNFVFVIDFALLLILFVQSKGIFSQLLNRIKWNIFSRYIYSLYITHFISGFILSNYFIKIFQNFVINYPQIFLIVSFLFFIIVAILTYHAVDTLVKILYRKLIRDIKK